MRATDAPVLVLIGPGGQADTVVTGPVRALLAWLTGRGDGAGLSSEQACPLPVLPPW